MHSNDSCYANSIFEQPWWLDIVAHQKWNEVFVTEDEEVIGRFPFYMDNGRIKMPVLTQTCGIWIKESSNKTGNEHLSQEKKIIDSLLEQLPKYRSFKVALDSSREYFLPYLWKGYKVTPRVSYRIGDLTDTRKIYENFSKTVKKNIKSAQKKVSISTDANTDVLLDIMDKTFATQGRKYPVSREVVRNIVTECEKRKRGCMLTATDEAGNVHACSYFVYDENVFYYLISGSDSEFRSSGAQSLIIWEAIQFASKVSKTFDFEGSMIEGIETFFRRFGGKPIVYYEIQKQPIYEEIIGLFKPLIKKILGYKI